MTMPSPGAHVAHALVRAVSRLFLDTARVWYASVGKSADAARTSACATSEWRGIS